MDTHSEHKAQAYKGYLGEEAEIRGLLDAKRKQQTGES